MIKTDLISHRGPVFLLCLCLAGLALSPADSSGAGRESISLNGEWRFQTRSGRLGFPPIGGWEDIPLRVPGAYNSNSFTNGNGPDFNLFPDYPPEWGDAPAAWIERRIDIPRNWRKGSIFIRFEGVNYHSVVYLSGFKLGENWDGFLPFEFDLTGLVAPGQVLTLTVGVESEDLYRDGNGRLAAPHGSFWGHHHVGIWQDVFLEFRPDVRFEDIWVRPSVRDGTITVEYSVHNHRTEPVQVSVDNSIVPLGDAPQGPAWSTSSVTVPARDAVSFTSRVSMPGARFWSPEDPFLYRLDADLSAGGTGTDTLSERFGFREFRISGADFLLNGTPIKLRGDSWHWMGIPYQRPEYARLWFETARALNINTIRLHAQVYPEFYLDIADELGMMIIDESAWWASALDMSYSQSGWNRLADHLTRLVERDRGHPSVVLWSLANEIVAAARPGDGLGGQPGYILHMAEMKNLVESLDGSRPVYAEGDSDGFGLFDMVSFHYAGMQEGSSLDSWRTYPKPVSTGEAGAMHYATPNFSSWAAGPGAYLDYGSHLEGVAGDLRRLIGNYRLWMDYIAPFNLAWYGLEPLPFAGEPIEWPDLSAPGVKPGQVGPYTSTFNAGYDPALPDLVPNPVHDAIRDGMEPVRLICPQRTRQLFSGREVTRDVYAVSDLSRPVTYTFQWLETLGEQTRTVHEQSVSLGPFSDRLLRLTWNPPAVAEITDGTWTGVLLEGETEAARLEIPFTALPPVLESPDLDLGSIAYYGPGSVPPMDAFGVTGWTRLDSLTAVPGGVWTLIIAAGSALGVDEIRTVFSFVAEGGEAVVCRDNAEFLLPEYVDLIEYPRYQTFNTYELGYHALSEKFGPDDLRYWSEDSAFSSALRGFRMGNARPILWSGMGDPVVVEVPVGAGHLFFSEVNSGDAGTESPGSLRFLRELLRHARSIPARTYGPAGFLGPEGSHAGNLLRFLNVSLVDLSVQDSPSTLGSLRHVIVDASDASWAAAIPASWRNALFDLVAEGGTVVLWGLSPDSVAEFRFVLPESPVLWQADHPHLVPAGDTLSSYIHPGLLYWVEQPEGGVSIMSEGIVRTLSLFGREDHLVAAGFDWRALVYEREETRTAAILRSEREPNRRPLPLSALSTWRIGSGTVAVSLLRTDVAFRKNDQLVATVLTNLGIRIDPFPGAPDVAADLRIDWRDLFLLSAEWRDGAAKTGAGPAWPWGGADGLDILSVFDCWHNTAPAAPARKKPVDIPSTAPTTCDTRITPEGYLKWAESE